MLIGARVTIAMAYLSIAVTTVVGSPDVASAAADRQAMPAAAAQVASVATCAPLDLVLVLDTTGSMTPAIDQVVAQVDTFVSQVGEVSGGDYRLGLIDFGEGVDVRVPFSDGNADEVRSALSTLSQGGGNAPEAWDEALATAVANRAAASVPDGDQVGDFTVPWREEAEKMVVLVSDARPAGFDDKFEDPVDSDRTMTVAAEAARRGIRVASFFVPNGRDEGNQTLDDGSGRPGAGYYLKQVADRTGAPFAATDADGSNLDIGLEGVVRTCAADTDGDGLPDSWETDGLDVDGDGTIDLDLAAMGADPEHKDLFVQVNWMPSDEVKPCKFLFWWCGAAAPPRTAALERVVQAFAKAPVANPDGRSGIALHIDAGDRSPKTNAIPAELRAGGAMARSYPSLENLPGYDKFGGEGFVRAVAELRDAEMDVARRKVFTWSMYAHRLAKAEEEAEGVTVFGVALGLPSDTFLLAGATLKSDVEEASTFMHELGHTLGLRHGGTDHAAYKANYVSIMNYAHAHTGGVLVDGKRRLDYSRWSLAGLDERDLDERTGLSFVGTPPSERVESLLLCGGVWPKGKAWNDPKAFQRFQVGGPVDWDCDGPIESGRVRAATHKPDSEGSYPVGIYLGSQEDWNALTFTGGERGGFYSAPDGFEPDDELTEERWREMPKPNAIAVTGAGRVAVDAGQPAMLAFDLENFGTEDDAYDIAVAVEPGGDWMPLDPEAFGAGEVAAGDHGAFGALFAVPGRAVGSSTITVTVTSKADADVSSEQRVELIVGAEADEPAVVAGDLSVPARLGLGADGVVDGAGFAPGSPVLLRDETGGIVVQALIADADGSVSATIRAGRAGDLKLVAEGRDGADGEKLRRLNGTIAVTGSSPAGGGSDGSWVRVAGLVCAVLAAIALIVVLVVTLVRRGRSSPPAAGGAPLPPPPPPTTPSPGFGTPTPPPAAPGAPRSGGLRSTMGAGEVPPPPEPAPPLRNTMGRKRRMPPPPSG